MVMRELVAQIHSEMVELFNEGQQQGESPRVLLLIGALIRLTDLSHQAVPAPACKHEHVENGVCAFCGGEIPSLQTSTLAEKLAAFTPSIAEPAAVVAKCPPHDNINPYGVCVSCGTCLHQFRSAAGICHQCGEQQAAE